MHGHHHLHLREIATGGIVHIGERTTVRHARLFVGGRDSINCGIVSLDTIGLGLATALGRWLLLIALRNGLLAIGLGFTHGSIAVCILDTLNYL